MLPPRTRAGCVVPLCSPWLGAGTWPSTTAGDGKRELMHPAPRYVRFGCTRAPQYAHHCLPYVSEQLVRVDESGCSGSIPGSPGLVGRQGCFCISPAGARASYSSCPVSKDLPTELNAISALSMLGVHLRVVYAVTSLREQGLQIAKSFTSPPIHLYLGWAPSTLLQ